MSKEMSNDSAASPAAPTVPTDDRYIAALEAARGACLSAAANQDAEYSVACWACAQAIQELKWEAAHQPLAASAVPAESREPAAARVWNDALAEVRATVAEMQNHLEAFGEYSQETARCVLDGVLDVVDEIIAEPIEIPTPQSYALVPIRVTQAMRKAWDTTPSNEDDDVEFAHAYQRMIAASVPPTIPRWDQLIDWKSDRQAAILMVEGLKSENALLRASLNTKGFYA